MNQQEIWDRISGKWYEYKKVTDKDVIAFLKGCSRKTPNKSFASSDATKRKGSEPAKLLDVGCGSGRNFFKSKNLKTYGVDFSAKMLGFAKKEAKRRGMSVILKKGRSEKIPFEDGFFDYALCNAVLHCIDTPKKRGETVKEIFRILKRGGVAYISVWNRKGPRLDKIKEIKTGSINECFIPWIVKEKRYPRYTYLFSPIEMKKMIEDAGFELVAFEDDGRNLNFTVRKD